MQLKTGDIITKKDLGERKVLEVFTNTVLLSHTEDFDSVAEIWTEKELLDKGWIFPKEKFI